MHMAPPNSQTNRMARLYTPLDENTLSLMDFSGLEAVNEINNFKVKAVAADGPVDLDALLGQPMRIELDSVYNTTHHIHQAVYSARFWASMTVDTSMNLTCGHGSGC